MITITHYECKTCGEMVAVDDLKNHPHPVTFYSFGSASSSTDSSIEKFKGIIAKYVKTPICDIPVDHREAFSLAVTTLTQSMGPKAFQEFIKSSMPSIKPMTEQDMINFFNFEMGGPFNQNLQVNMGGLEC